MTISDAPPRRKLHGLEIFSREEFGSRYFWYEPGQHVLFGGPTQRGKTELAFNMLQYVARPDFPAYVAVCKPNDPTTAKWGKRLGFKRVTSWPIPPQLGSKPPGYLVWPKFGDVNTDVDQCARVTRSLLENLYAQGAKGKKKSQCTIVLDDTVIKSKILRLDDIMTTHLAMAGAMGIGGWYFVQKPTDSGRTAIWSYSMCEHAFLFSDPVKSSRERYDEIGGVDPHFVENVTMALKPFQCLYIRRTGAQMCIIDKD